ncbi:hypothetical protein ABZ281_04170 [Streptomyces sp. NPDC006265]|uniref:hypothetical protein n=1 Tax=Streptomyces sp. NPDC006265 TaxID=3156740 RepID=UPI0033AE43D4
MEEKGDRVKSGLFPSPEQEQVLGEIVYSGAIGAISEEEIRARLGRAGFARHHADDVVTAVEWLQDDLSLSSMDDAMRWGPES